MLVGYGGNNGTTFNAALISNKLHAKFLKGEPDGVDFSWRTREATKTPNFYGSMTQSATIYMGEFEGKPVYVPLSKIVPMVHPD
jgi:myo-inositol-1-phosphate synthase